MTQEFETGAVASAAPPTLTADTDSTTPGLAPVRESDRINVLDVLRGFALIGILMMNIEWFNRAIAVLTMPDLSLRDADHAAGFLVKVFVEGKFYKLFSLLFGMGFAVMLLRAEQVGRPFFAWFSRRAGALLLIGLLHSIFLWTGDILHDYAIGAFGLLGILWLRRGGKASYALPVSVIMTVASVHALLAMDAKVLIGYTIISALVAFFIWLRGRDRWRFFRNPQWLLRIAIAMSILPILIMSTIGIVQGSRRDPQDLLERHQKSEAKRAELTAAWPKREIEVMAEARKIPPGEFGELADGDEDEADDAAKADKKADPEVANKPVEIAATRSDGFEAAVAAKPAPIENDAKNKPAGKDGKLADKDEPEKSAAEQWFQRKENRTKATFWEVQAMTSPNYWVATRFRFVETLEGMKGAPFFALMLLMPIFMLGWWLVETGKIRNPEQHLVLFRTLAWVGWPFGLAFSVSSSILMYQPNWIEGRGSDMLIGLLGWCGQVLLCAAYVGTFVLLLRKSFWQRFLSFLAPLGRMALTNYLTHSLVFSILFYGYGAGWFGQVSRFPQMGLVLAMITFQVIFSSFWLSKFNYGPMEWLWRSATYLKWQTLRRSADAMPGV